VFELVIVVFCNRPFLCLTLYILMFLSMVPPIPCELVSLVLLWDTL